MDTAALVAHVKALATLVLAVLLVVGALIVTGSCSGARHVTSTTALAL
jgi:hypothetical protein